MKSKSTKTQKQAEKRLRRKWGGLYEDRTSRLDKWATDVIIRDALSGREEAEKRKLAHTKRKITMAQIYEDIKAQLESGAKPSEIEGMKITYFATYLAELLGKESGRKPFNVDPRLFGKPAHRMQYLASLSELIEKHGGMDEVLPVFQWLSKRENFQKALEEKAIKAIGFSLYGFLSRDYQLVVLLMAV